MEIRILFFGSLADSFGMREMPYTLETATTVGQLLDKLTRKKGAIVAQKLLIAVNEEYSDDLTVLNQGDEVAIFTAVSGG